jgi:triosephosphate isomerase (TIM)
MRKKFICGNWKMFTIGDTAEKLAADVVKSIGQETRITLAVCPPFPYLARVRAVLQASNIHLGAQNLYPEPEGAFTGEVSPTMLVDVGCRYVILGHSERRHKLGESDAFINRKVHSALAAGLNVILCIGETLEQRESGQMEQVLDSQLTGSLARVTGESLSSIVLAYEPVWAIGTGRNATPDQAQQAHAHVRKRLADLCGPAAEKLIIQYGGSVKPDNAAALLSKPDVDGALIGGASLQAAQFVAIARAAL